MNVPVEQRAVGMVFQSYAIWPHMTVAENVAFPLTVMKHRKYSRAEIEAAVAKALAVVDLAGFQDRPAPRLSGGQQQRVALARAIVHEPRLLLLDEPLVQSRRPIARRDALELKRLQSKIGITTVYVTHDQSEALALSDQIAVIDQGRIRQFGSPEDIYFRPGQSVRRALRRRHQSAGRTAGRRRRTAEATSKSSAIAPSSASFRATSPIRPRSRCRSGRKASAWCRAPAARWRAGDNCIPGKIAGVTFLGATRRVDVTSDGVTLQVTAAADLPLPADGEVDLLFAPERTVALPGKVS